MKDFRFYLLLWVTLIWWPGGVAWAEGVFSGRVVSADTRTPVQGAVVKLTERNVSVQVDVLGRFRFEELPPGTFTVLTTGPGFLPNRRAITITPGQDTEANIRLQRISGGDVIVIREKQQEPDPVVRTVTVEEIQRVPGTFGDAIRVVQNLPGVARSPFGLGFLIVRGTEPEDTGTYVDGIRVPLIFHFGGLTAVINSDMLERVTFLPGGFGARYGRNLGGVVDVSTVEAIPLKFTAYADIDLIDSTLYLTTPVGEEGGLALSARRSYIDTVLKPVLPRILPEDSSAVLQLPVYEDYQVLFNRTLGDTSRLHVLAFGSRDRVNFTGGAPAEVDPLYLDDGSAGLKVTNNKLLARWTYVPNTNFTNKVTIGLGPETNGFKVGAFGISSDPFLFFFRDDFFWSISDNIGLRGGVDGLTGRYAFTINLPFALDTSSLDPLGEPDADSFGDSGYLLSISPYLEGEFHIEKLQLVPGIRIDPYRAWDADAGESLYKNVSIDPRLSYRYELKPKTMLKGSVGRFSQSPSPFATYEAFGGDPTIGEEWALQTALGAEHRFTPQLSLDGSAYWGELRDLVVAPGTNDGRPTFQPVGAGRNRGMELLLRRDPGEDGFFGWISYTLQQAKRVDILEEACPFDGSEGEVGCSPWYPFDYDQTHILTAVASQKLPRGWEVGLRFRYTTGSPYTPVVSAYYDVDDGSYTSFSGEVNSERYPGFHQLDLRVDKKWVKNWGELSASLEVLNTYNRKNPESINYNYDYTQSQYVSGIPIFPAFGIKAKF